MPGPKRTVCVGGVASGQKNGHTGRCGALWGALDGNPRPIAAASVCPASPGHCEGLPGAAPHGPDAAPRGSADLPSGRRSWRPGCGRDAAKSLCPASKMGIGPEIATKVELSQS